MVFSGNHSIQTRWVYAVLYLGCRRWGVRSGGLHSTRRVCTPRNMSTTKVTSDMHVGLQLDKTRRKIIFLVFDLPR